MVTATWQGHTRKVDGLLNRGEWWGKTWAIVIPAGFEAYVFIAEADTAGDAVDVLIDSRYYHLVEWDKTEPEEEWTSYGGNCGLPYNSELVEVYRCKVNYFAKRDK